ncbi:hypothetical protein [Helicobacter pylori]|uniref:hypothetical protein n=1 Tax=Helicobacter pylori TaxID=210 RepID=UPI001F281394|nr:hypothetical protein [Helicobacter pylori]
MRTRESHSYLKIQSILKSCVRKGFYIIQNKTIVNILTPKSLEMQLLQKLSQNKAEALDLENIDRLVEKNHSHGSLARHVREGYFILDTHLKE